MIDSTTHRTSFVNYLNWILIKEVKIEQDSHISPFHFDLIKSPTFV